MRTLPKLPPVRCRHRAKFGKLSPSPARRVSGASAAVPPAQRVAAGVPPAGEAQRGPAVCAGARAQRGRRLGAGCVGAARRRRKPFQRRPPRLHGAGRARRPEARISRADAPPDPQPKCERAVCSGRRQHARSGGGHLLEQGHVAFRLSGALGGRPGRRRSPANAQNRQQSLWRLGAAAPELRAVHRALRLASLRAAEVDGTGSAKYQRVSATTAPASSAASQQRQNQPNQARQNGPGQLPAIGRVSDRMAYRRSPTLSPPARTVFLPRGDHRALSPPAGIVPL